VSIDHEQPSCVPERERSVLRWRDMRGKRLKTKKKKKNNATYALREMRERYEGKKIEKNKIK
jgi:hypothetical protein